MRLLIRLKAQADAAYETAYHHKLRGRLWKALRDTTFEEEHGNGQPMGLAYSNIFPWGRIEEGNERTLLISSPREGMLSAIASDLKSDREFNVGEMPFHVDDMTVLDIDVGEPGSSGVLETATGVVVRLYDHHRDEYGIDAEQGDAPTYWRPEHSMEPFVDAIHDNLQEKYEQFGADYRPGPKNAKTELFDEYELIKTYSLPTTVTTGVEITMVLSKWRLGYEVRDDDHRQHLNLALDTGIGGRNGLGFGFINRVGENV